MDIPSENVECKVSRKVVVAREHRKLVKDSGDRPCAYVALAKQIHENPRGHGEDAVLSVHFESLKAPP